MKKKRHIEVEQYTSVVWYCEIVGNTYVNLENYEDKNGQVLEDKVPKTLWICKQDNMIGYP